MNKGSVLMIVTDGIDNCGDLKSALQQIEHDPKIALYPYRVGVAETLEAYGQNSSSSDEPLDCGGLSKWHFARLFPLLQRSQSSLGVRQPWSSTASTHLSEGRSEATLNFQFRIDPGEIASHFNSPFRVPATSSRNTLYFEVLKMRSSAEYC